MWTCVHTQGMATPALEVPRRFFVRFNGDDARITFETDSYDDACAHAARRSVGMDFAPWLGQAVFGPSGKVAVYREGALAEYLDGGGRWVTIESAS